MGVVVIPVPPAPLPHGSDAQGAVAPQLRAPGKPQSQEGPLSVQVAEAPSSALSCLVNSREEQSVAKWKKTKNKNRL